jgi:hypothetical protein
MSKPKPSTKNVTRAVLAKGEMTGHAHVAEGVGLLFDEKTKVLEAPTGAEVVHEEHHKVNVPPGSYDIRTVQESDPFGEELRQVRD